MKGYIYHREWNCDCPLSDNGNTHRIWTIHRHTNWHRYPPFHGNRNPNWNTHRLGHSHWYWDGLGATAPTA